MADARSTEPPLETAADAAGPNATEAFKLLGNDTRLAILLALWDASEQSLEGGGLSFTELRDRVGIRQGGQFNYHLDKLTGRFVERTDDGYELENTGEKIIRTVIGAAGFDAPTFETTEIDMACRHCGGQTALSYDEGLLYRVCTECEGTFESSELPEGCLSEFKLAPAALADRTPEEMFAVAKFQALQNVHNMMEGICPECSGPVDKRLEVCEAHETTGVCDDCGRADPVRVRFECPVCKDWSLIPVATCVMFHPAVVGFYYEHGFLLQWDVDEFDSLKQIHELIVNDVDLVADDPSRIHVTFCYDGDGLRLTLDEELNVVAVIE